MLAELKQVHGPDVIRVSLDVIGAAVGPLANGDAMVTQHPDIALRIITADCGPVLFADPHAGIIGAAHAGWRGALSGVLENTLEAMVQMGATRAHVHAALGPCIHQSSYQVGADMRDQMIAQDDQAHMHFMPDARDPGKFRFDLPGFILRRLSHAGIEATGWVAHDTYTNGAYNSYRRATHQGLSSGGRQVSVIAMRSKQ